MKYGKEFQQILQDSSFPPDWKDSAIEYRQLKKLIKNVVSELTTMGLSPGVLHKLLVTEDTQNYLPTATVPPNPLDASGADDEVLEFEFESPEGSPSVIQDASFSSEGSMAGPSRAKERSQSHSQLHPPPEVVLDPLPPTDDDSGQSSKIISPHPHHHRKFRLRLLSDNAQSATSETTNQPPLRAMSVAEFLDYREKQIEAAKTPSPPPISAKNENRGRTKMRKAVMDGHGGVKAEYVLTGDPNNPIPQLRLHLSTSASPTHSADSQASTSANASPSPSPTPSGSLPDTDTEDDMSDTEQQASPTSTATPRPSDRFENPSLPSSPTLDKIRTALSPIWAIASGEGLSQGMGGLTLDERPKDPAQSTCTSSGSVTPKASTKPTLTSGQPDDQQALSSMSPTLPLEDVNPSDESENIPEIFTSTATNARVPASEREFIIPLSSDLAFFHLLTSALTSLSTFHAKQQNLFKDNVESLCSMISSSISPSSTNPEVISVPMRPSERTSGDRRSQPEEQRQRGTTVYNGSAPPRSKSSKKDLYAWREIFSLWIESEIFESNSERDRGERTVEEAEKRLTRFANEVVKRGLGDRRTMVGKKSRKSWEEFLRLNVLLLDLKRFQVANINAARKILKKHDKRTALTASAGFPSFVRSTLSSHVDRDGNISTWTFFNTSLPHVLLASLTDTLLPILPSLDDYACLICTSIAFKPIRLGCGHLFCVRCLVKMQRAGKEECPLCRSKVILLADKNSLDMTVMNFMKEWFPKEVKAKQRENEDEVDREDALVHYRPGEGYSASATASGSASASTSASASSSRTVSGPSSRSRAGIGIVPSKDGSEKCVIM